MSCKDILVHFDNSPIGHKRLEAACRLAERHDAHLTALLLAMAPQRYTGMDGYVPPAVVEALAERASEDADRAVAALDAALARQSCRAERRVARCWPDEVADVLALHARYADLLVLGQPGEDATSFVDRLAVEDVLMSSGRPVLLIPYIGARPTIGERIVVAWNGGRESARAVADAMPLIEKAASVHVLTVDPQTTPGADRFTGSDIAAHLARHGVPVEALSLSSSALDAADLTLNWMAEQGTDLLVMGAYGHSRVRELVLGGMTRSMLEHMTVPVLMAH